MIGVVASALGGVLRRDRNLERARHPHDRDVVGTDAGRRERRERARLQAIGDEVVVLRHDEREPEARRVDLRCRSMPLVALATGP